ncbi:hypothetical protein [Ovoidimarina sediminis]|uniref:hypothetical protein n=1 Tax=Ovoidimarina sediminis TaxID=3079856 RepID=UPI0029104B06|nr:hypothetical protein [Rhodophyticola sp. MJ-SS7]MDU8942352.1 hypothetical protein [Rhodophyticola sp. MJ-SS7]
MTRDIPHTVLLRGASILALSAMLAVSGLPAATPFSQAAHADSHGGQGQGSGGGHTGGEGHGGDHGEDHAEASDHGQQGQGPQAGGGGTGGQGQGAPDPDSEGRGPKYGQGSGETGGKPVWAQEGIPEIELGRLNVARSPDHVLERAYDEALSNFTAEMAEFYNLTLEEAITELSLNFDDLVFIDSPLQNLALLKDALDGASILNTLPEVSNSNDTLLAMFLGTASDKTVEVTPDTAYAVSLILGYELTEDQAIALAADAEAIRIAILAGHG